MALLISLPCLLLVYLFIGQVIGPLTMSSLTAMLQSVGYTPGPSNPTPIKVDWPRVLIKMPQSQHSLAIRHKKPTKIFAATIEKGQQGHFEQENEKESDKGEVEEVQMPFNPLNIAMPVDHHPKRLAHMPKHRAQEFIIRMAGTQDRTQLFGMFYERHKHLVPKTDLKPSAGFKEGEKEKFEEKLKNKEIFEVRKQKQILKDLANGGTGTGAEHTNVLVAVQVDTHMERGVVGYLLFHRSKSVANMHTGKEKEEDKAFLLVDMYIAADYQKKGIGTTMLGALKKLALAEGIKRVEMAIPGENLVMENMMRKLGGVEKFEDDVIWELPKGKFEKIIREDEKGVGLQVHSQVFHKYDKIDAPKSSAVSYSIEAKQFLSERNVANAFFQCPHKTWAGEHVWLKWIDSEFLFRKDAVVAILAKLIDLFKENNIDGIKWALNPKKMMHYDKIFEEVHSTKTEEKMLVCNLSPADEDDNNDEKHGNGTDIDEMEGEKYIG